MPWTLTRPKQRSYLGLIWILFLSYLYRAICSKHLSRATRGLWIEGRVGKLRKRLLGDGQLATLARGPFAEKYEN
jgi:hypothetical protein